MRLASTLFKFALGLAAFAVVVAILFPPESRSRTQARRSYCHSNMRQIIFAVQHYHHDYDKRFPPVQTSTNQGWVDSLLPYTKSRAFFLCAENRVRTSDKVVLSDYFYNAQLSKAKMKSLRYPASTILVGDGILDAPLNASIASMPQGWRDYKESPVYRHLGGANYAFTDGHIKWLKPEKITLDQPKKLDVYTFLLR